MYISTYPNTVFPLSKKRAVRGNYERPKAG